MSLWDWLFRRRQREEELEEEVQCHLRMAAQDRRGMGENAEQARASAVREFGNVALVKEVTRDMWGFGWLETLVQDVRFGLRMLARNPGFTAVAVLTLALGIGGTTAIFSVLYGGLLNPWPFKDSGRLAVLVTHDPKEPQFDRWAWVSPAEFIDLQEQNHVFDHVIGGLPVDMLLTGPNRPTDWFGGMRLTPDTFQVLGMTPVIGRSFTSDDAKSGAPPVILLNHKTWQSKFAGDPRIVGKTIILNHQPTTVVGVMPPRFTWYGGGGGPDGWLPAAFSRAENSHPSPTTPVVGHLKPGVTLAQASADLELLTKRLAAAFPEAHPKEITFSVLSLTDACVPKGSRSTLDILMAGVGLLLLIACVNMANLLLARANGRERELAIRASLGAGHVRMVRQLMIESLLLALGGAVLGCLIAWGGMGGLAAVIPPWYMPDEAVIRMNLPVLLFAAGITMLSTLAFGLAPAVLAVKKDLQAPLKASGHTGGESRRHHRLRNLLVVSELALSLVLLTGAGLLFRSFWTLRHTELGYSVSNVLGAFPILTQERYKTAEQINQFHIEALRRVRALPGVASATLGWPMMPYARSTRIEVVGQPNAETQTAWFRFVGDRFFETLGIPLLAGRTISEEDLVQSRHIVVVNRAFVQKYFEGANPLGRQINVQRPSIPWFPPMKEAGFEIVGVVRDTTHEYGPEPTVQPQVFLPATVVGNPNETVFVRTVGDPAGLVNAVRKQFAAMNNELPVEAAPIRDDFRGWYTEPNFVMAMLAGFALLGMTLVCVGVYSILSYSVSQRTHEIGVRMALGAEASDVRWWVLKAGLRWLLVGIGIGVAGSIALAKILQNRIWGIKSADPLTLVAVSLLLAAVGLAACYFPARRATKVDPMEALRYE